MAINKVVNRKTSSHGAMRNVIEYVLRDDKVRGGYVEITGPYKADTINYDDVYKEWIKEKRIWDKDSGRMYAHNIISFHKDEQVNSQQVLDVGKKFADRFFSEYQCLIGVHQDKEHMHCHIITNSVSYINGLKLHQTKKDLQLQKDYTNDICVSLGLSRTEMGKHFEGTSIEEGEIRSWNKDKYNLLKNDNKKSFLVECAIAIMDVIKNCFNKNMFISGMKDNGWQVNWEDNRKHITFVGADGNKVRDSNISKTFNMNIGKEALLNEFERQNKERVAGKKESDIRKYYDELESTISGTNFNRETVGSNTATNGAKGQAYEGRKTGGYEDDTEDIIRESRFNRRNQDAQQTESEAKRDDSISKRSDRDDERERQRVQIEQAIREETARTAREAEARERAIKQKRERNKRSGWER